MRQRTTIRHARRNARASHEPEAGFAAHPAPNALWNSVVKARTRVNLGGEAIVAPREDGRKCATDAAIARRRNEAGSRRRKKRKEEAQKKKARESSRAVKCRRPRKDGAVPAELF